MEYNPETYNTLTPEQKLLADKVLNELNADKSLLPAGDNPFSPEVLAIYKAAIHLRSTRLSEVFKPLQAKGLTITVEESTLSGTYLADCILDFIKEEVHFYKDLETDDTVCFVINTPTVYPLHIPR